MTICLAQRRIESGWQKGVHPQQHTETELLFRICSVQDSRAVLDPGYWSLHGSDSVWSKELSKEPNAMHFDLHNKGVSRHWLLVPKMSDLLCRISVANWTPLWHGIPCIETGKGSSSPLHWKGHLPQSEHSLWWPLWKPFCSKGLRF